MFIIAKATGEVDDYRGIRGRFWGITDPNGVLVYCSVIQDN